ncbi:MAG: hypothetical protein CMP47_12385 [Rickettsiales bacterium]|nr:hypothetical protein [Rickettsiales bacterium]|tara:strand:+ start:4757 stop:5260 length:504 start_codon:yes stop_codon:yes gene_type:complete
MSKAAITGHTRGLGAELAKLYPDHIGFSLSQGYDIGDYDCRHRIVQECADVDIIFNNAHSGFYQVDLLYQLYEKYRNTDKIIVNISSNSPETSIHRPHKYSVEKMALDVATMQLKSHARCRIVVAKPGLFESNRSLHIEGEKMSPRFVAQQIKVNLLDPDTSIINIQ